MSNEPADELFASKMQKVCNVLVVGEGFVDAEVAYEPDAAMVSFRAPGAISCRMRRDEFDQKSDCEIAFFVSVRMRRPVASPGKPGKRAS
jgi:hypothetical protein